MSEDEKLQRLEYLREKAILDEHDIYEAGLDKGEKLGERRGIEKGKLREKKELAKKMKNKNIAIETIIEITELTKKEIEKL